MISGGIYRIYVILYNKRVIWTAVIVCWFTMKKLLIILVLGGLCVGCGYETPEEKELREYRFQEELNL